jgi:hypothetical protein
MQPPPLPKEELTTKDWVLFRLLLLVPLVGFITCLVFAFAKDTHPTRKNYSRSSLIIKGIVIIAAFILTFPLVSLIWGTPPARPFPWPKPIAKLPYEIQSSTQIPKTRIFTSGVIVTREATDDDLKDISKIIIEDFHPVDSLIVFFSGKQDGKSIFAKVTWSPKNMRDVPNRYGDYSVYTFTIDRY